MKPRGVVIVAAVVAALAFGVGHTVGGNEMAGTASDCRAAVDASLDEWQGVDGASERYEMYVGRCIR